MDLTRSDFRTRMFEFDFGELVWIRPAASTEMNRPHGYPYSLVRPVRLPGDRLNGVNVIGRPDAFERSWLKWGRMTFTRPMLPSSFAPQG